MATSLGWPSVAHAGTWYTLPNVTSNVLANSQPSVAIIADRIYSCVVNASGSVKVRRLTEDGDWKTLPDPGSLGTTTESGCSIAGYGGTPYVTYVRNSNGIKVKKFVNGVWRAVADMGTAPDNSTTPDIEAEYGSGIYGTFIKGGAVEVRDLSYGSWRILPDAGTTGALTPNRSSRIAFRRNPGGISVPIVSFVRNDGGGEFVKVKVGIWGGGGGKGGGGVRGIAGWTTLPNNQLSGGGNNIEGMGIAARPDGMLWGMRRNGAPLTTKTWNGSSWGTMPSPAQATDTQQLGDLEYADGWLYASWANGGNAKVAMYQVGEGTSECDLGASSEEQGILCEESRTLVPTADRVDGAWTYAGLGNCAGTMAVDNFAKIAEDVDEAGGASCTTAVTDDQYIETVTHGAGALGEWDLSRPPSNFQQATSAIVRIRARNSDDAYCSLGPARCELRVRLLNQAGTVVTPTAIFSLQNFGTKGGLFSAALTPSSTIDRIVANDLIVQAWATFADAGSHRVRIMALNVDLEYSEAQYASMVPNFDRANTTWQMTTDATCSTTSATDSNSVVDEGIDQADDSSCLVGTNPTDHVSASTNGNTADWELSNAPPSISAVTDGVIRIRMKSATQPFAVTAELRKADGTLIGATQTFTGTVASTYIDFSACVTTTCTNGLSLTRADLDGAFLRVTKTSGASAILLSAAELQARYTQGWGTTLTPSYFQDCTGTCWTYQSESAACAATTASEPAGLQNEDIDAATDAGCIANSGSSSYVTATGSATTTRWSLSDMGAAHAINELRIRMRARLGSAGSRSVTATVYSMSGASLGSFAATVNSTSFANYSGTLATTTQMMESLEGAYIVLDAAADTEIVDVSSLNVDVNGVAQYGEGTMYLTRQIGTSTEWGGYLSGACGVLVMSSLHEMIGSIDIDSRPPAACSSDRNSPYITSTSATGSATFALSDVPGQLRQLREVRFRTVATSGATNSNDVTFTLRNSAGTSLATGTITIPANTVMQEYTAVATDVSAVTPVTREDLYDATVEINRAANTNSLTLHGVNVEVTGSHRTAATMAPSSVLAAGPFTYTYDDGTTCTAGSNTELQLAIDEDSDAIEAGACAVDTGSQGYMTATSIGNSDFALSDPNIALQSTSRITVRVRAWGSANTVKTRVDLIDPNTGTSLVGGQSAQLPSTNTMPTASDGGDLYATFTTTLTEIQLARMAVRVRNDAAGTLNIAAVNVEVESGTSASSVTTQGVENGTGNTNWERLEDQGAGGCVAVSGSLTSTLASDVDDPDLSGCTANVQDASFIRTNALATLSTWDVQVSDQAADLQTPTVAHIRYWARTTSTDATSFVRTSLRSHAGVALGNVPVSRTYGAGADNITATWREYVDTITLTGGTTWTDLHDGIIRLEGRANTSGKILIGEVNLDVVYGRYYDDTYTGTVPAVSDGSGADYDWSNSATSQSVNFTASTGDAAGVRDYDVCLTQLYPTAPTASPPSRYCHAFGNERMVPEVAGTSSTQTGLSLVDGTSYYWCVRTRDNSLRQNVGQWTDASCSDGFRVDTTGPTNPTTANIFDVSTTFGPDVDSSASTTALDGSWNVGSDALSGVASYNWCFSATDVTGTGSCSAITGTNTSGTGNVTRTVSATAAPALTAGNTWFLCVRTLDVAGNLAASWRCSDGVTITAPPGPSNQFTNEASAQSTAVNPVTIRTDDPRMSWINNAGSNVDRYHTEVVTTPLDSTVVGLWKFESNGNDDAGADHNATISSAPTDYEASITNFGNALELDGDDYASVTNSAGGSAFDTTTFTIEGWFRIDALVGGNARNRLFDRAVTPTNAQFNVAVWATADADQGKIKTRFSAAGVTQTELLSDTPVNDGQWHHVAFVVEDADKSAELYVDGVLNDAITMTNSINLPNRALNLGTDDGTTGFMNGALDDVRFSNVARTGPEILGYVRTNRPHYDVLWDSGSGGTAMSSCATATRCADITYAGPALDRDSAQYYARTRYRTVVGSTWTSWSGYDWFRTSGFNYDYLTGFEHGVLDSNGSGIAQNIAQDANNTVTIDNTTVRNGTYSMAVTRTDGVQWAQMRLPAVSTMTTVRVAVRFNTLPSTWFRFTTIGHAAGQECYVGYNNTVNRFVAAVDTGTNQQSSMTVTAGQWYVIDLQCDTTNATRRARWRIDAVSQTDATLGSQPVAENSNFAYVGSAVLTDRGTAYFDDVAITEDGAQYPIGDGRVVGLRPDGVGTHATPGNFREDAGATGLGALTWQRLIDAPMSQTNEWMRQEVAGGATYAEWTLSDPALAVNARAVRAVVAVREPTSTSGLTNASTRVAYSDGTTTTIHNGNINSSTSSYRGAMLVRPSTGWTTTQVNALKVRMGYGADVTDRPYWDGVVVEAEYPPAPGNISMRLDGYDGDDTGPNNSPTTIDLGTMAPGATDYAETRTVVTTNAAGGYTLSAHDPDANGALYSITAAANVPWHPSGTVGTPAAWGANTGIGISAFGGASTPAKWCTGGQVNCTAINDADLLWAALTGTSQVISSKASSAPTGDTTRVPIRFTVPAAQAAGSYSGLLTFTAAAQP